MRSPLHILLNTPKTIENIYMYLLIIWLDPYLRQSIPFICISQNCFPIQRPKEKANFSNTNSSATSGSQSDDARDILIIKRDQKRLGGNKRVRYTYAKDRKENKIRGEHLTIDRQQQTRSDYPDASYPVVYSTDGDNTITKFCRVPRLSVSSGENPRSGFLGSSGGQTDVRSTSGGGRGTVGTERLHISLLSLSGRPSPVS